MTCSPRKFWNGQVLKWYFSHSLGNIYSKKREFKTENIKVPLWRKLHLFYRTHFKTLTSSLHDKKNAVYYFQISLFAPEIFKFLKYGNEPSDVMSYTFNQIVWQRYLSQFVSEMFDSLQCDSTKRARKGFSLL